MVAIALVYMIVSGLAALRGYKSPLFGAAGVILCIVLELPATALMPDASEDTRGVTAAVAAVACVLGLVLLLPRQNPRSAPKKSAVPYAALAVACLLLALAVATVWFFWMPAHAMLLLGAALLLSACLGCFRLHKQQSLPSVSEILRKDTRPPVLFLRSFESDSARVAGVLAEILPMFPVWMGTTFEETLAPAMQRLGPFVALGNPEDYLPSPGAAKAYQDDDAWQEFVLDLLRRAGVIIIQEGVTPGLRWELSQVRQHCSSADVFFVTPDKTFARRGWSEFARLLQETGFRVPS
ncbi:MAG TPA: hypothetical protein VFB30_21375, partial [Spirochaetia bacterium]|nr:hypothetical protein [Spirochaetia bacterium]